MNAEDVLIILPVNNTVLFPGVVLDVKSRLDRAQRPERVELWRL